MIGKDVDNPGLINIDNHDFKKHGGQPEQGQLFFKAVVQFKDTFTKELPKFVKGRVSSITIKTDFADIPSEGDDKYAQDLLCKKAFDHMGVRKQIRARFPHKKWLINFNQS